MKYFQILFLFFVQVSAQAQSQIPPRYSSGAILNHELNYQRLQHSAPWTIVPARQEDRVDVFIDEQLLPCDSSANGVLKTQDGRVIITGLCNQ